MGRKILGKLLRASVFGAVGRVCGARDCRVYGDRVSSVCLSTRLRLLLFLSPQISVQIIYLFTYPQHRLTCRLLHIKAYVLPGPPSSANLLTMLGPTSSYSALV